MVGVRSPAPSRLRPAPEARWAGDDDHLVLLHRKAGEYYLLNASAAAVWRHLCGGARSHDPVGELAATGAAEATPEVDELLAFLRGEGLLVEAAADAAPAPWPDPRPARVAPVAKRAPRIGAARVVVAWATLLRFHLLARRGLDRLVRALPTLPAAGLPEEEESALVALTLASLDRAAALSFGGPDCLPRSAAATWLLRRRRVAARMALGVRPMPFFAHAWVEVGGRAVGEEAWVGELQVLDRF